MGYTARSLSRLQLQAKSRKYQGVFEVKSRVKTWQVRGIWSQQLEHKQVPKWGTEPGVRKGKRSLLASHTRCKCSMETTHNSVKVKLGIKFMKLVESLIGREVTVGQGSECHLTFVRGYPDNENGIIMVFSSSQLSCFVCDIICDAIRLFHLVNVTFVLKYV